MDKETSGNEPAASDAKVSAQTRSATPIQRIFVRALGVLVLGILINRFQAGRDPARNPEALLRLLSSQDERSRCMGARAITKHTKYKPMVKTLLQEKGVLSHLVEDVRSGKESRSRATAAEALKLLMEETATRQELLAINATDALLQVMKEDAAYEVRSNAAAAVSSTVLAAAAGRLDAPLFPDAAGVTQVAVLKAAGALIQDAASSAPAPPSGTGTNSSGAGGKPPSMAQAAALRSQLDALSAGAHLVAAVCNSSSSSTAGGLEAAQNPQTPSGEAASDAGWGAAAQAEAQFVLWALSEATKSAPAISEAALRSLVVLITGCDDLGIVLNTMGLPSTMVAMVKKPQPPRSLQLLLQLIRILCQHASTRDLLVSSGGPGALSSLVWSPAVLDDETRIEAVTILERLALPHGLEPSASPPEAPAEPQSPATQGPAAGSARGKAPRAGPNTALFARCCKALLQILDQASSATTRSAVADTVRSVAELDFGRALLLQLPAVEVLLHLAQQSTVWERRAAVEALAVLSVERSTIPVLLRQQGLPILLSVLNSTEERSKAVVQARVAVAVAVARLARSADARQAAVQEGVVPPLAAMLRSAITLESTSAAGALAAVVHDDAEAAELVLQGKLAVLPALAEMVADGERPVIRGAALDVLVALVRHPRALQRMVKRSLEASVMWALSLQVPGAPEEQHRQLLLSLRILAAMSTKRQSRKVMMQTELPQFVQQVVTATASHGSSELRQAALLLQGNLQASG